MSDWFIGLLSAALATNQQAAFSNLVEQRTGLNISIVNTNDPVEAEFAKLMAEDDAAQAEVDGWVKENQQFAEKGAGSITLEAKIKQRFESIKKRYDEFLVRHPKHGKARVAYASFLSDIGDEDAAFPHLEKAKDLDPQNPAVWNQLANWHGHNSPVTKSFEYYQKAIDLAPGEPTYYWNFATTVYLFRSDATNFFNITEQQVFEKALALYKKAVDLDPENFELATDFAQTYYGVKIFKAGDPVKDREIENQHYDAALGAWERALKLARDDIERQGVLIHFARLQINAGRFEAARTNLAAITNPMFDTTKRNLVRKMEKTEKPAASEP